MIEIGEVLEVTLRKSPSEPLGFSIRGGRDRPSLRGKNVLLIRFYIFTGYDVKKLFNVKNIKK